MNFLKKFISRKLIAYLAGIIVLFMVKAGVPEELAGDLMDQIVNLTIWYMGAQGAVDVARTVVTGEE
tara:strand:- start:3829 stop:4029 length:201 start_codon:yes stop_codon:yes gene_type:complete